MAFKFISALYTDPEVMNLWQLGIEGTNYQVLDDGTAYYVDGEDASNFKYHQNTGWFMGNQFNTYVLPTIQHKSLHCRTHFPLTDRHLRQVLLELQA